MVEIKMKTRVTGATATMAARGHASLVSETGGALDVTTGVSDPGFNPLDMLYASLAACLVLSVKGAVVQLHLLDGFESVTAHVTGEKAHEGPSRVAAIRADIRIAGPYTEEQRAEIVTLAKKLCTVSNTLSVLPEISVSATAA
ncbi:OsmC family protein [Rhizobium sp. CSW-27]|uniref:OsmC family protein n=1 Tax=Rhizobium sp. CSW-27 TaxID=2839985 RepID=UPI001C0182B7|nr:OsmC family protein [Rhizobium sp. CSW-27]MBT9370150.1 OsmC family protein [Rhizobium sp. CSW-27]